MAQNIPQQLATYIDETCGLHNTGGVAQFFDEDGNLRACQPGESVFAFSIACSLVQYEEDEHDYYKNHVWNMIQGDIDGLKKIQEVVDDFILPEPRLKVGMTVRWTDPDDGACSGVYKLVDINEGIYFLENESGSEVQASWFELEVEA